MCPLQSWETASDGYREKLIDLIAMIDEDNHQGKTTSKVSCYCFLITPTCYGHLITPMCYGHQITPMCYGHLITPLCYTCMYDHSVLCLNYMYVSSDLGAALELGSPTPVLQSYDGVGSRCSCLHLDGLLSHQ